MGMKEERLDKVKFQCAAPRAMLTQPRCVTPVVVMTHLEPWVPRREEFKARGMLSHLKEVRYYSYYSCLQMKDALGRQ
ncbi:unnamed protein product, partial [Gulo gulo]